jgi:DNA-binding PadR family transcriptional regulator
MDDRGQTTASSVSGASRFEFAPPRRFVLPAVLLLLSEQPGHGYSLEKDLRDFNFGKIDRPTVYRALADLERDGLVSSSVEAATAGHARRVYGITRLGQRVLRVWMSVINEERDRLARVLRRYQATGSIDAVLAEVEGGWAAALGFGWSPVSSTSVTQRRLTSVDGDDHTAEPGEPAGALGAGAVLGGLACGDGVHYFRLVPDRSVVLVEVRSTVGPLSFGAVGVTGTVVVDVDRGSIRAGSQPTARLEVAVAGLRSGNRVYDAELLRRIDARRFPVVTLDLSDCLEVDPAGHYRLTGELDFHGVTRRVEGTVDVATASDRRLVVTGEQVLDIRDFAVPSPTVLMLRIYPDVRVHLHVEAELEEA